VSRILALSTLFAIACGSNGASGPEQPHQPEQPVDPMIARICESAPCSGRFARIQVWRTSSGEVGRYVYDGDIDGCSHPPRVFYDAQGEQSFAVPFEPIVPGSPEAEALRAQQEAQTEGLVEAERASCPER
jgi:hypothetical protein